MSEVLASTTSLYPERAIVHEGAADRWVRASLGRWQHRLYSRRRRFLAAATQAGVLESDCRALGDARLRTDLAAVARRIWRDASALPLALALARESAFRSLGVRPYAVQLAGAACLIDGCLAEMQTGEGKTITAGLAAAVVAIGGRPVHVVTVNDYLASRDAHELLQLFTFLGLRVGTIVSGLDWSVRAEAYQCDVTYCTGKELVFDYLKDRAAAGSDASGAHLVVRAACGEPAARRMLLRGLHFAIVDEADSIFIDEARTPLILAEKAGPPDHPERFAQGLQLASRMRDGIHFAVHQARRSVELSQEGRVWLSAQSQGLARSWTVRAEREHMALQGLRALHLFHRDRHYIVRDGKIQIIDEQTGRVLDGRTWEQGLHQMIEAKEDCGFSEETRTTARITYQRFFRRYLRLSGMTGTAREASSELWTVYGLQSVTIPTHRPVRRSVYPPLCLARQDDKWLRVADAIQNFIATGRPVLIGTRSVADSEKLSGVLTEKGLVHRVLNARQDSTEAELVRTAGQARVVTIATNMAGRGTDIKPSDEVRASGGLHVILTEFHESPRIDRQLFGRAARQGDPGSAQAIVALDDEMLRLHARAWHWLLALNAWGFPTRWSLAWLRAIAQRNAERLNRSIRRSATQHDEQLARSLGFSGKS